MATTLPGLVGNYLNTHHMWLIHADSSFYDAAALPAEYLIPEDLDRDAKIKRTAEVTALLARRLAKVETEFPHDKPDKFRPENYFGFPPSLAIMFSYVRREGKEAYVKVDPDLLVPEFRDVEYYWVTTYHQAFHRAYPNEVALEKTRRFFGSEVRVVKEDGEKKLVTPEATEVCGEWEDRLLHEIGPEMQRRLAAAQDVIQGAVALLFERNNLDFISHSCTLDEQWRQSMRRDFHGTLEEFLQALPDLYDRELFARLEEYPTLAMDRTFSLKRPRR
jgi:hypothetical protein